MNARKYLEQIEKYDNVIVNKLEEIRRWKAVAVDISPNADGMKVQTSGKHDKLAKAVSAYVDLETELTETMSAAVKARQEIISTIELLPADYYDLLHKKYVQMMDLQTVAMELDRSYRCISARHKVALEKLQSILDGRKLYVQN